MENKMQLRKRYEQGLTLIEASMVLALSAVVVAGVMLYYQSASENNKFMAAESELASLQTIVQSIYGNSMGYTGLTTAVARGNSSIPPNLRNATGDPVTPWGGTSTIAVENCGTADGSLHFDCTTPTAPNPNTPTYQIVYRKIPIAQCIPLISQNIPGLVAVDSGGTTQAWTAPLTLVNGQVSVKAATDMCSAAGAHGDTTVDIAWQLM
jgi:Tfp pilus assembly protein PilW